MRKFYKITRVKDNTLVGLSRNPLKLYGYNIEEINESEYTILKQQLWLQIQNKH